MSLLPGNAKILEYKIIDHLGSGGFANTYIALDTNLDKKVAIKEFFPLRWCRRADDFRVEAQPGHEAMFGRYLAGFIEEARILAKFDQRNIVKVLRYFEALGTGFIIMEFVDGKPIGDYVAYDNILGEERVGRWLKGLLTGLEAVHAADLIHGDIKPLNIIIDRDDEAVLIDFGASALYRSALETGDVTGERYLSPNYAAPEQLAGSADLDRRLDLYSLGAVFFEAVTGEKFAEARKTAPDIGAELQRYRNFYNAKLLTSIAKVLADDPAARFSGAAQWRDFIGLSRTERLGAFYRRHRRLVAAAVILLAVAGVVGAAIERHGIDARNYKYKLFASSGDVVAQIRRGEGYREKLRDARAFLDAYEAEYGSQSARIDPQNLVTGRNSVAALAGAGDTIAAARRRLEAADRQLAQLQERYYFDDYPDFLVTTDRIIGDFSVRQTAMNRALLSAFVEHRIIADARARDIEIDRVALNELLRDLGADTQPRALGELVSTALPIVDTFIAAEQERNRIASFEAQRAQTIEQITILADGHRKSPRFGEFAPLLDEARAAERPNQLLASQQSAQQLARDIERAGAAAAARRAELQRQREVASLVAAIERDMVKVDPGVFQMGSNRHGYSRPPRAVTVGPFHMLKNEVVNAQWDECVKSRGCRPRNSTAAANDPVTGVTWDDAQAFTAWLNQQGSRFAYRLPTEAEWEYVVRTFGYVARELTSGITDVAVPQTNNGGLNSIVGNALEWLDDCWHGGYVGAPADSRSWNRGLQCDLRVVRGSNWQGEHDVNAANVAYYRPFGLPRTEARATLGFRLAGDVKQ